jgi:hypothetical protein
MTIINAAITEIVNGLDSDESIINKDSLNNVEPIRVYYLHESAMR